ncbi:U32 family peptidase, partial [Patescibacteria group bacterium]|nr:U32 family peptidase [Patescibacteria group bacterium]
MFKPELLAPAGDWKSFIVAVEAGADAVYFGGKDFSARSFAINLTREEIQKAIDYAHLRGAKCYGAVNILAKDNEFAKLFDYINFLCVEGIDALIIQDLGVLNFCQKHFSDLPLHASTQMTAHNLNDVLVLKKMG